MLIEIRITATGKSYRFNARNVSTIENVSSNETDIRLVDGTSIRVPVAPGTVATDIETAAAATTLTTVSY